MGSQLLGWCYTDQYATVPHPQAVRLQDGDGTTQGTHPTTASETGPGRGDQACQRIVRYRGYQTFVALQNQEIFRSTDGGASWSTVYGADGALSTSVAKAGPFVVYRYVNGVWKQWLVILARTTTAGTWAVLHSEDGSAWAKVTTSGLTDQTMPPQSGTLWCGQLFFAAGLGGSARTLILDCQSFSVRQVTPPNLHGTFNDTCHAILDHRLFGLWTKSNGAVTLHEYVPQENAWVERLVILASGPNTTYALDRKSALFADQSDGKLYAVFAISTGASTFEWRAYAITVSGATFTPADVTAATVSGVAPFAVAATARVAVIADGPAGTAGQQPEIGLFFNEVSAVATPVGYYAFRWNGGAAAVTSLGTTGPGAMVPQVAYPWGAQYGGNPFWVDGNRTIELTQLAPLLGAMQLSFTMDTPEASPDDVQVSGYFGNAADEYVHGTDPTASLSNPSSGAMGGDVVTGLDAAAGGIVTVDWTPSDQPSDPPAPGAYAKLVLSLTVSP